MASKIFIDANSLLIDSFKLAKKIYQDGFRPDFLIGIWRGGTPPAIAVHEFFTYKGSKPSYHTAIKAESYKGIEERGEVTISGMDQFISKLSPNDKVLIIDDIFDTGKSIEAVKGVLAASVDIPVQLRVATVYFKPEKNLTDFYPDYYIKAVHEWVVFPHELEGLSETDLKEKGPGLYKIIVE